MVQVLLLNCAMDKPIAFNAADFTGELNKAKTMYPLYLELLAKQQQLDKKLVSKLQSTSSCRPKLFYKGRNACILVLDKGNSMTMPATLQRQAAE